MVLLVIKYVDDLGQMRTHVANHSDRASAEAAAAAAVRDGFSVPISGGSSHYPAGTVKVAKVQTAP